MAYEEIQTRETNKKMAMEQRQVLADLFRSKNRPVVSRPSFEQAYILTRDIVDKWRAFIRYVPVASGFLCVLCVPSHPWGQDRSIRNEPLSRRRGTLYADLIFFRMDLDLFLCISIYESNFLWVRGFLVVGWPMLCIFTLIRRRSALTTDSEVAGIHSRTLSPPKKAFGSVPSSRPPWWIGHCCQLSGWLESALRLYRPVSFSFFCPPPRIRINKEKESGNSSGWDRWSSPDVLGFGYWCICSSSGRTKQEIMDRENLVRSADSSRNKKSASRSGTDRLGSGFDESCLYRGGRGCVWSPPEGKYAAKKEAAWAGGWDFYK